MENLAQVPVIKSRLTSNGFYDKRFIKQVVQEIEEGMPFQTALSNYGLKRGTLRDWMKQYGSLAYLQSRRKVTSPQMKRSICRAVQVGTMTITEASLAQHVHTHTIKAWLLKYQEENTDLSASNRAILKKKKSENKGSKEVSSEILALQEQLAYANLKVAALNTLIDVAEEQLKINIRKKPGTKQL